MRGRRVLWRLALGVVIALAVGRLVTGFAAGAAQATALGVRPSWRLFTTLEILIRVGVSGVATLVFAANLLAVRHSIVSVVLPRQVGNLRIGEAIPMRTLTLGTVALALAIGSGFALVDVDVHRVALALRGVTFAARDPILERDLGWFLVRLPMERALWEVVVLVIGASTVLTFALYAGTPSVRVREGRLVVSGWVRRHLACLSAAGLLLLAWHWRLVRFELLATGSDPARGFSAVDHRVVLPYLTVLSLLTVPAAIAVGWTIWRGATRAALVIIGILIIAGPVTRGALGVFVPPMGVTSRAITEREASYARMRAQYRDQAEMSWGAFPLIPFDPARAAAPAGAIITPDGARYRVVEDASGEVSAPALVTWRERLVHAWALQNPRLLFAGGRPGSRLLLGADPRARVRQVAPFLRVGSTVALLPDGAQARWAIPLEVEGGAYPLATPRSGEESAIVRYRRPAGMALVDPLTGAVRIVPVEDPDPILRAWMRLVPDVFAAGAERLAPRVPLAASPRTATDTVTSLAPEGMALRDRAAALYDAMEEARRAGDWAAYGVAWRELGVLLGRRPPD